MTNIKHTIVIGAGQAGLAASYYLKQAGHDFPVLDANESPLLESGQSTVYPEVSFLGQPNLRRPNSSLIGGVGRDAAALI